MKITKCIELDSNECLAVETTVKIIEKLIENFDPNESYDNMFCLLVDHMDCLGHLPNVIKM